MTRVTSLVVLLLVVTLHKFGSSFTVPTLDGGLVNDFLGEAKSSFRSGDSQDWWTDFASVACVQPDFFPVPDAAGCTLKRDVYTINALGLGNNWHEWCIVCPFDPSPSSNQTAKVSDFLVWLTQTYASKTDFNQNVAFNNFTRLQIVVTDMPTVQLWPTEKLSGSLTAANLTAADMLYVIHSGPDTDVVCSQSLYGKTPPECTKPFIPPYTPSNGVHDGPLSSLTASLAAATAAVAMGCYGKRQM